MKNNLCFLFVCKFFLKLYEEEDVLSDLYEFVVGLSYWMQVSLLVYWELFNYVIDYK